MPLDLESFLPSGALEVLTTLELGAFVRLLRFSWRQQPPCSLPDVPDALAAVAGVTPEQWQRLPRLSLLWTRSDDGRLHFLEARAVFERLAANLDLRRRAGTAAARARWGSGSDANRMRIASDPHADRIPLAPQESARTREERSRSSAPPEQLKSLRSLGAQSAEVIARIGSAGARALAESKVAEWRAARSREMLQQFIEHLRSTGKTTLPLSKAIELAEGPYASPEQVEATISRVKDRLSVGDCPNPSGYLISGLGVGPSGASKLIEIPVHIGGKWANEEAAFVKRIAVAAATAAQIEERRQAVRESHRSIQGA